MTKVNTVCLVDDDIDVLDAVGETLRRAGYRLRKFHGAEGVVEALGENWPGIVLTDMRMPRISGINLLERLRAAYPAIPVVLFSAHGDIQAAIRIMRLGGEDFVEKPIEPELLLEIVARAMEKRRLSLENAQLNARLADKSGLTRMLWGKSPAIRAARDEVQRIAASPLNALVAGETGTGKALAARAIHAMTVPQPERFVQVGCKGGDGQAALAALQEIADTPGEETGTEPATTFSATLYLRDVEALPHEAQDRVMQAAGPAHVRVIGGHTGSIADLRSSGRLFGDFLFWITGACLEMPPLRARPEDVVPLLNRMLDEITQRRETDSVRLDKLTGARLAAYAWPGNTHELRNVAERCALGLKLHLAEGVEMPDEAPLDYETAMQDYERGLILQALADCNGKKARAAERLGIPRKRLYLRMKALGMG